MTDPLSIDPNHPEVSLPQKIPGRNLFYAPQPVTAPPAAPSWATGSGSGPYLTSANTTELTAMYNTLNDIYNALLKEGLIKKK